MKINSPICSRTFFRPNFNKLEILSRILDEKSAPFVVAELSGNHGGGLDKALKLVSAAKEAGADAIKLQTYRPDTITVKGTDGRFKLKTGLWKGKFLHELYEQAMTPWEWHPLIAQEARNLGMICFSSPFDESAVDFLEESIQPALYKVASFEMNHFPLLERIGKTEKPVLASVGVSESQEIFNALKVLRGAGCPEVILLHCVSEYPAKPSDFCLRRMPLLESDYKVKFGLSDHSLGHLVAVAATALGARVIEKHLCLDRDESSIDGAFSMLPQEFADLVSAVRLTHEAMSGSQPPKESAKFKRSILVSNAIQQGDRLTPENVRIARPGDGLCPSRWTDILGQYATIDMSVGHPLSDQDIEKH
ncbi:MAG: pseudaminic acid synthase [Opitutales bacterium]|nr:pseudaminic acid synthase [Opitutales bacterium]